MKANNLPSSPCDSASPQVPPVSCPPLGERPFAKKAKKLGSKGFATIIAVLIIALLVICAVGSAMFLQIEVRTGATSSQITQARENALYGLEMAIMNLQEFAGPDQRVTARADILKETSSNGTAIIAGLSPTVDVLDNNRNWIGVWDASKLRTTPGTTAGAHALNNSFSTYNATTNRKAKPIAWLISSVDNTQNATNNATIATAPATITTPAWNETINIKANGGNETFVTLLGNGSVDTDNTPADAVVAGRVAIEEPAASGANGTKRTGSYAWWVGDESLKAKYNLVENQNFKATFGDNRFAVRNTAPTFNSIDAMTGISDTLYPKTTGNFTDKLRKMVTMQQVAFVEPDMAASGANGTASPIKLRFHDMTLNSLGLLTDTKAGGLKEDLSVYLFNGPVGTITDNTIIYDQTRFPSLNWGSPPTFIGGDIILGAPVANNIPYFGILRSWANSVDTSNPNIVNASSVRGQRSQNSGTNTHGIHPILTHIQLPMAVRVTSANTLDFGYFPAFVLWNPYNKELPAKQYLVGYGLGASGIFDTVQFAPNPPSVPANIPIAPGIDMSFLSSQNTSVKDTSLQGVNAPFVTSSAIFMRTNNVGFQPGEVKVFSLKNSVTIDVTYTGVVDVEDSFSGGPYTSSRDPVIFPSAALTAPATLFQKGKIVVATMGQPVCAFFSQNGTQWELLSSYGFLEASFNGNVSTPAVIDYADPVNQGEWQEIRFGNVTPINFPHYFSMMTLNMIAKTSPGNVPYGIRRGLSMYNPRGESLKTPLYMGNYIHEQSHSIMGMSRSPNSPAARQLQEFSINIDNLNSIPTTALYSSSPNAPSNIGATIPLFYLPRRPADIISMGQFQHVQFLPTANAPTYQFGNSYIHPMMERERYSGVERSVAIAPLSEKSTDNRNASTPANFQNGIVDSSFMVNEALWDRFFLSGINGSLSANETAGTVPLPNPRLKSILVDGKNYNSLTTNATRFTLGGKFFAIDGPFNINSTSVESWKAILSSLNKTEIRSGATSQNPVFPRIPDPIATATEFPSPSTPTLNDAGQPGAYTGFRALTPTEVEKLAQRIVDEVKLRGPFISLSDFVNRRLIPTSSDLSGNRGLGLRGALQSAIDRVSIDDSKLNASFFTGAMSFNNSSNINIPSEPEIFLSSTGNFNVLLNESSFTKAADIPGYLTQADILQKIGSFITPRGDTFVIRSYGDSVNAKGNIQARAYCEAVVQRTTEPVTPDPTKPTLAPGLGRKFKVLSVRWLSPEEV